MLELLTTFLAWDLAVAAGLAGVLGAIVVVQGSVRAAASALRGSPLPSRVEAGAAVRVPAPRAELVGSGR